MDSTPIICDLCNSSVPQIDFDRHKRNCFPFKETDHNNLPLVILDHVAPQLVTKGETKSVDPDVEIISPESMSKKVSSPRKEDFWTLPASPSLLSVVQDSLTSSTSYPASKGSRKRSLFSLEDHMRNLESGDYGVSIGPSKRRHRKKRKLKKGASSFERCIIEANEFGRKIIFPSPPKLVHASPKESGSIQQITHQPFLRFAQKFASSIRYVNVRAKKESKCVSFPSSLPPTLVLALRRLGFNSIYKHQLLARDYITSEHDVMITTPTGSGKSLCFNIPVFEHLMKPGNSSCALYLFPLNALATDQQGKLNALNNSLPLPDQIKIAAMTGKTPYHERTKMFSVSSPRILVTNPDLLHFHLRKKWEYWIEFLKHLKFVVLDEAHTYNGILGAHMANLMRRLLLAVESNGGKPSSVRFIFSSATVGNSKEMAMKLIGRTNLKVIGPLECSASIPQSTFLIVSGTENPLTSARKMLSSWSQLGFRSIVFCNSIGMVHSLMGMLKQKTQLATQTRVYYSSMPTEQKNQVMFSLRKGTVRTIVSTNALEAGIDLPDLDAILLLGYSGSRMSLFQRMGRAGRTRPGLVAFVPFKSSPLDLFFLRNPHPLLSGEVENVVFNQEYPSILSRHLLCACKESTVHDSSVKGRFGIKARALLESLKNDGRVTHDLNLCTWIVTDECHNFSLRGSFQDQIRVLDPKGYELQMVNREQALTRLFPGAHFPIQESSGALTTYLVDELNLEQGIGRLSFLTRGEDSKLKVLPVLERRVSMETIWNQTQIPFTSCQDAELILSFGWGNVLSTVLGRSTYEVHQAKSTLIHTHYFSQPYSSSFSTPCLSFSLNQPATNYLHLQMNNWDFKQAGKAGAFQETRPGFLFLHTIFHQLLAVVPLLLLFNSSDAEEAQLPNSDYCGFLIDACEGGTGVCETIFRSFSEFASRASQFSRSCRCGGNSGCELCLYRHTCVAKNKGLFSNFGLDLLLQGDPH